MLQRRGWKTPAPPERKDTAEFSAIFDTDIQSPETRDVLTKTLRRSASKGRFARFANLDMDVSGCFMTEQEEPLLLLPDYMAGAFHHAHRAVVLGRPVAPQEEVREAVKAFTEAQGTNLHVVEKPFDEIHPLTGMEWDI